MNAPKPHPTRTLILLALAFVLGELCFRNFRFTHSLPNYLFQGSLLVLPFFAIRSLLQLSKIAKFLGFIVLSPILFVSLLFMIFFATCGAPELARNDTSGCMKELQQIKEATYSVHMVRDGCGGAMVSFIVIVEQRIPVLPGLYRFRVIDAFDSAYEGRLTSVGPNQIRVQIPRGVNGSGWNREVDHVYQLNPNALF